MDRPGKRLKRPMGETDDYPLGPGPEWDGRVLQWVDALLSGALDSGWCFSFPSQATRDEYVDLVHERTEEEVLALLDHFLPGPASFGADRRNVDWMMRKIAERGDSEPRSGYERRLQRWLSDGEPPPHPGVQWCLDLLPRFPRMAIAAAEAYLVAEAMFLPDGRVSGLSDAMALIRARYIGVPSTAEDRRLSLYSLSSREFEVLVHRLYDAMGYDAELTPPRSDGGRDVIAIRQDPTCRASLRVECKLYQDPVGVEVARAYSGSCSLSMQPAE